MTSNSRTSVRRSGRIRKGLAAVELAVCLPLLMLLTMGAIETTDLIFLRQRLMTAAFEAARTATAPGRTSEEGVASGTATLTARAIQNGKVTISPTVTSATETGTEITATVAAPFAPNSCLGSFVFAGRVTDVSVAVRMVRQ